MKTVLFLILFISSLYSKETIRWMIWDLPPNFILEGKLKGQGYQEQRLKMIQARLPQYHHESIVMNLNRAKAIYKGKDDTRVIHCTNDFISHPELDIDDYLSIAIFPFRAFYLVTTKEKAHLFGKDGESLSLKEIIRNENLRLIVSKNRPYLGAGKVLKAYLEENPNAKHINKLSTLNIGKSMFGSIFKNRADYTFEYINKITYYGNELGVLDKTAIFPMKENADIYYGYASCVKTQKGKEVITELNEIFRELKYSQEWVNAFAKWLPTQKLKDDYLNYYNEVFLDSKDIYDDNPRSK